MQHPAGQQPSWPDQAAHDRAVTELGARPPLIFAGEARRLTAELARVCRGEAFLLQAGDCAESFDVGTADAIRDKLKIILQMAAVLQYSGGAPVVKIGRIAGQFGKPRSADMETVDGVELPSFRGHIVNDFPFDETSRVPDPARLVRAYEQSASTLNLLRAFTRGGYADLRQVHEWNREFIAKSPIGQRYEDLADRIDKALRFMASCGIDLDNPAMSQVDLYTSHEALILGYEQALTRTDSITGDWYDCSAHMLWIGERTRDIDGAHMQFLAGVHNPLGCKIGPTVEPDELLAICEKLNPDNVEGRLTLISRMGADAVIARLTPLLEAVRNAGQNVVWACDPMHGNTFSTADGTKTRHFDDILREVAGFFAAHNEAGTWAGGLHIELTGDDVAECLGGGDSLHPADLHDRYKTMCDPRLNGPQSVDLAFQTAELMMSARHD